VKRTKNSVKQKRKILFAGGSVLLGYAVFLVFLCIQSATLSYQINSLEKDVSQLQTSQNRMNYQIAQAQSLDRVQKIAEQQLGMSVPAINASVRIEEKQPVVVASQTLQGATGSKNFLQRLSANISHLAQKVND
jgi:cell division protein FtsL